MSYRGPLLVGWRSLWITVTVVVLVSTCVRSVGVQRGEGYATETPALGEEVTVVTWNIAKGTSPRFDVELRRLFGEVGVDFLLVQEATSDLEPIDGVGFEFAGTWRSPISGTHTGVATCARLEATRVEAVTAPARELYVATTKASLITVYPLFDGRELLVCNVHALNFDPTGALLDSQLADLERRLAHHQGPMILGGDLNTWSQGRLELLAGVASRLGMVEVTPDEGEGRTADNPFLAPMAVLGLDDTLALDRLYCRGLVEVWCRFDPSYESSDHVPMIARLRLEVEG